MYLRGYRSLLSSTAKVGEDFPESGSPLGGASATHSGKQDASWGSQQLCAGPARTAPRQPPSAKRKRVSKPDSTLLLHRGHEGLLQGSLARRVLRFYLRVASFRSPWRPPRSWSSRSRRLPRPSDPPARLRARSTGVTRDARGSAPLRRSRPVSVAPESAAPGAARARICPAQQRKPQASSNFDPLPCFRQAPSRAFDLSLSLWSRCP